MEAAVEENWGRVTEPQNDVTVRLRLQSLSTLGAEGFLPEAFCCASLAVCGAMPHWPHPRIANSVRELVQMQKVCSETDPQSKTETVEGPVGAHHAV